MSEAHRVLEIVRAINDCWLEGRYDELRTHFAEEMVLAMPGFEDRVEGREAIVDSYRQFGESVIGPTAVATASFEIEYVLGGATYREAGTDLLVLQRNAGTWRVVWRTVMVSTSEGER
jgi:hypothetical protein